MNTRRYPRSTVEAFPRTAEYGAAIRLVHLSWRARIGMWFARFFT